MYLMHKVDTCPGTHRRKECRHDVQSGDDGRSDRKDRENMPDKRKERITRWVCDAERRGSRSKLSGINKAKPGCKCHHIHNEAHKKDEHSTKKRTREKTKDHLCSIDDSIVVRKYFFANKLEGIIIIT